MKKKIHYKGFMYDFWEEHTFIGKLDITEAFLRRQNDIQATLAMKAIAEEENERYRADNAVLFLLEDMFSESFMEGVKFYLEECENTTSYSIETELQDGMEKFRQEENEYQFKYVYIWQTVGMAGDDYSGIVFIPLPDGTYFRFEYWM